MVPHVILLDDTSDIYYVMGALYLVHLPLQHFSYIYLLSYVKYGIKQAIGSCQADSPRWKIDRPYP